MLDALILVRPEPEPATLAVIVLAEKLPPESRWTMVDALLAESAVVRALAMVPEEMFEALIALMPEPSPIKFEAVTLPAVNAPLASRKTKVDALLAELPVVKALLIVPLVMFEALILVTVAPLPDMLVNVPVVADTLVAFTSVAVMMLAVNDPLASRATIVEAPLAELAVVLAFASVPTEMLDALIETLAALVIWPWALTVN
jgi:hypothetical protein